MAQDREMHPRSSFCTMESGAPRHGVTFPRRLPARPDAARSSTAVSDTGAPLPYMQDEGFILLPEVLDATGVRKAFLVGQSDGGSIALLHSSTQRASPRVCGLLLEAPHVFCEEVTLRAIEHARDEYLLGDLRAKLERYHGGNVDCAFWGWNQAWLGPGVC